MTALTLEPRDAGVLDAGIDTVAFEDAREDVSLPHSAQVMTCNPWQHSNARCISG